MEDNAMGIDPLLFKNTATGAVYRLRADGEVTKNGRKTSAVPEAAKRVLRAGPIDLGKYAGGRAVHMPSGKIGWRQDWDDPPKAMSAAELREYLKAVKAKARSKPRTVRSASKPRAARALRAKGPLPKYMQGWDFQCAVSTASSRPRMYELGDLADRVRAYAAAHPDNAAAAQRLQDVETLLAKCSSVKKTRTRPVSKPRPASATPKKRAAPTKRAAPAAPKRAKAPKKRVRFALDDDTAGLYGDDGFIEDDGTDYRDTGGYLSDDSTGSMEDNDIRLHPDLPDVDLNAGSGWDTYKNTVRDIEKRSIKAKKRKLKPRFKGALGPSVPRRSLSKLGRGGKRRASLKKTSIRNKKLNLV